jgi:histidinol-phosphate aminotransferase
MTGSAHTPEGLLRPEVLALSAYHVPDSKGFVKLDAMENPYAWPSDMVDAWLERLRRVEPNRYPDPECKRLKAALAEANGVPAEAGLLLGNGSDEIIQIIQMALKAGSTVMAPEPTFVMYRQISASLGLPFVGVPLRAEDFDLDIDAFCAAIEAHQPAAIFLAYPNNPTGNLFDDAAICRVLAVAPGLVVVDEAYAPYADASFMARVGEFPNLLVMRTLSKLGLAGLRLGFAAGPKAWIGQLDKIRLPYNINVLTQLSAEFALEYQEIFDEQVRCLRRDRQWMAEELERLEGVRIYGSRANFILFRLLGKDAQEVFGTLKAAGILVKNLHPAGGLLSNCLRVTVGTPEENRLFLAALSTALNPRSDAP